MSAIVGGRPVCMYPVLERISDRLGIPRGYLGLAYAEQPTYGDQGHAVGDQDDDVKRRAFLAAASAAVVGRPVLGEALALTNPVPDPAPPSRLTATDVAALRHLTERFRSLGRAFGGYADVVSLTAAKADRLLAASGTEQTERALRSALAELHILAGWCSYDAQHSDQARHHYDRAMRLAAEIGDVWRMVSAVQHAAIGDRERGSPDSALKLYQLAQARLMQVPATHPRTPLKQAWLHAQTASAYALLGRPEQARDELARSRDWQQPDDPFEHADMLHLRALIELDLGNLDAAEQYASKSTETWQPADRRDAALALITLAVTHAQAREPDTDRHATAAIDAVNQLRSARAKAKLEPLEQALHRRADSTSAHLAERARLVRHS